MSPASRVALIAACVAVFGGCSAPPDGAADADTSSASDAQGAVDSSVLEPGPRTERWDLGEHETGADGLTGEIGFELPKGVTAIVVHAAAPDAVWVTIAALERDAGFALVPKAWLAQTAKPDACVGPCANRIVAQPGRAAFLFPNTPGLDMRPGAHRLRLYAFDASRQPIATKVKVAVDLVRPAEPPAGWRLPINLCLTGAKGWTAANALDQPRLVAALARARDLLAPAGLALDPVRTFDVDPKGAYIATQLGPDSDLAKLFRSGAGLPLGVNVFLTERVVAIGGLPGANVVLGLSGGLPGVPNEVGHLRAGIALSLVVPSGQDDVLGEALAHELGHYLGLFHTSEAKDGQGKGAHDTLPDTPEDDATNLMFWSVTKQATALSHEQIQVLRRSPWLLPAEAR